MSTQALPEVHTASRPHVLNPYLLSVGCVGVSWLLYHLFLPVPKYPLDDPYITLHSAQVLHWGFDPNYPGVPPLYGATSAPFLGLVYLLLFFLQPLRALEAACWLGILAYVLALVHLTRVLKLSRFAAFAIIALGLTSSFASFHLLNGLETCWAMAGIIWTLNLASEDRPVFAAFAAGLTAAIRPDLITFAVPIFAALVYLQPAGRRWIFVRRAAPLAVLPLILCAIWYLAQTGHLFPATGMAKHFYFADAHLPFAEKIPTLQTGLLFFVLGFGPLLLGIKRTYRAPLVMAIIVCIGLFLLSIVIQFPRGFFVNRFRYPAVIVPMLVWAVAVDATRRPSRRLLTVCLVYTLLLPLPLTLWAYPHDCRRLDSSLRATAAWCNQNLPADTRILAQDTGYIGYATRFRIIDFVGLKTPEAIDFNREYTWPTAGRDRAKAVSALALKEHAEYLIAVPTQPEISTLPQQLTTLGWQLQPLKAFPPYYVIYRIQPPQSPR